MNRVLGKKQNIANEDWIRAMDQIEELVPKKELDARVKATVKEIKDKARISVLPTHGAPVRTPLC